MSRPVRAVAVAAILGLAALAGCSGGGATGPGSSGASGSGASGSGTAASGSTTLTVFAAASLKGTFEKLASTFESEHPGVRVRLSFAGSSDLVAQIQQGAAADVIATADTTTMAKLTTDGLLSGAPVPFATNTLEIAVPPGNPAKVGGLADLAKPGVKLVLCAPVVPCGKAANAVEKASGVDLTPVSEEQSVKDVLAKVVAGEADAGLVYVTDVAAAGATVTGVPFPESAGAVNHYPIAALARSTHPDLAGGFVTLVTGTTGRAVLAAAGFGAP